MSFKLEKQGNISRSDFDSNVRLSLSITVTFSVLILIYRFVLFLDMSRRCSLFLSVPDMSFNWIVLTIFVAVCVCGICLRPVLDYKRFIPFPHKNSHSVCWVLQFVLIPFLKIQITTIFICFLGCFHFWHKEWALCVDRMRYDWSGEKKCHGVCTRKLLFALLLR